MESFFTEIELEIQPLQEKLKNHKVYANIQSLSDLSFFMQRHVFAVFDFMSLLYAVKRQLQSDHVLWQPSEDASLLRFVNEIILGEESDRHPHGGYISHFDLYCKAMEEVNSNSSFVREFSLLARKTSVDSALIQLDAPNSARAFTQSTFHLIERNNPLEIVTSFCFGREESIPLIFSALLKRIGVTEYQAPLFFYYIKRHIEVDSEDHGPLAKKLLWAFCQKDKVGMKKVKSFALESLEQRLQFLDQISLEISHTRKS